MKRIDKGSGNLLAPHMGTLHYSDDLDILRRKGIERPANVVALYGAFKKAPKAKGHGQEQTGLGI